MAHRLVAIAALTALSVPVAAQTGHDHAGGRPTAPAAPPETRTFLVEGLRVDPENPPSGSAVARAGARFGGIYAHVVYGRPYTRGRVIFGGVVPFDTVWATGAHQATEILFTAPVRFGGRRLDAGAYSLFTTPGRATWSVHLNAALGMHLADEYSAPRDVLTVDVAAETLDAAVPALTLDFVPAGDGVDLRIRWDRTGIRVPIRPAEPSRPVLGP